MTDDDVILKRCCVFEITFVQCPTFFILIYKIDPMVICVGMQMKQEKQIKEFIECSHILI